VNDDLLPPRSPPELHLSKACPDQAQIGPRAAVPAGFSLPCRGYRRGRGAATHAGAESGVHWADAVFGRRHARPAIRFDVVRAYL
jgi:hypothetical protein